MVATLEFTLTQTQSSNHAISCHALTRSWSEGPALVRYLAYMPCAMCHVVDAERLKCLIRGCI